MVCPLKTLKTQIGGRGKSKPRKGLQNLVVRRNQRDIQHLGQGDEFTVVSCATGIQGEFEYARACGRKRCPLKYRFRLGRIGDGILQIHVAPTHVTHQYVPEFRKQEFGHDPTAVPGKHLIGALIVIARQQEINRQMVSTTIKADPHA